MYQFTKIEVRPVTNCRSQTQELDTGKWRPRRNRQVARTRLAARGAQHINGIGFKPPKPVLGILLRMSVVSMVDGCCMSVSVIFLFLVFNLHWNLEERTKFKSSV